MTHDVEGIIINDFKTLSWAWVEESIIEDDATRAARARANELAVLPVSPGQGACLRMLAATAGAKAVIEIGTGTGVSGLWVLQGMTTDGVFTSIDSEAEYIEAARLAFHEGGVAASRTRLINGRALDVMPRMTAAGYDMVILDGDIHQLAASLVQARRIVRKGGIIAIIHSLWRDRVSDPTKRDAETVTMRQTIRELQDDPDLVTATLTCGDGITVAVPI
ncbi:MAG: class I SAM-dependent methyltransferase [Actinomycetaceae bacterium]|nr:class I SAM-dependent methyltransferase [Actinomycetaceae bacterium]MDU0969757.1 class I SAM-dependent methyltransferase [Actinomycetaceae bacterium]